MYWLLQTWMNITWKLYKMSAEKTDKKQESLSEYDENKIHVCIWLPLEIKLSTIKNKFNNNMWQTIIKYLKNYSNYLHTFGIYRAQQT